MVEHFGHVGAGLGEKAGRLFAALQAHLHDFALDALCQAVGNGGQITEHRLRDGLPPEDRQHADHAVIHEERIARKGDHALACRPRRIADVRIVAHVVGEQGAAIPRDASNFEVPDLDPAMWSVQMRVHARTCLQDERFLRLVQRPDARKRSVELLDQSLHAAREDRRQRIGAGQQHADLAAHRRKLLGFGGLPTQFQHGHDLPGNRAEIR